MSGQPDGLRYDAVVLAGGHASRMDGVADKTRLLVGERTLLDRALDAVVGASTVVVVGDERPTVRPVAWAREEPAGSGPAAAVAAALPAVSAGWVVLLAGDLPFVTPAHLEVLLVTARRDRGAVLVDPDGIEQWLCSAWRASDLRGAHLHAGGSLRAALRPLRPYRVHIDETPQPAWLDCDTPEDLRRARELA